MGARKTPRIVAFDPAGIVGVVTLRGADRVGELLRSGTQNPGPDPAKAGNLGALGPESAEQAETPESGVTHQITGGDFFRNVGRGGVFALFAKIEALLPERRIYRSVVLEKISAVPRGNPAPRPGLVPTEKGRIGRQLAGADIIPSAIAPVVRRGLRALLQPGLQQERKRRCKFVLGIAAKRLDRRRPLDAAGVGGSDAVVRRIGHVRSLGLGEPRIKIRLGPIKNPTDAGETVDKSQGSVAAGEVGVRLLVSRVVIEAPLLKFVLAPEIGAPRAEHEAEGRAADIEARRDDSGPAHLRDETGISRQDRSRAGRLSVSTQGGDRLRGESPHLGLFIGRLQMIRRFNVKGELARRGKTEVGPQIHIRLIAFVDGVRGAVVVGVGRRRGGVLVGRNTLSKADHLVLIKCIDRDPQVALAPEYAENLIVGTADHRLHRTFAPGRGLGGERRRPRATNVVGEQAFFLHA